MTAREIVKQEYGNSRNLMTRRVLSYGKLKFGAYELSKGEGIYHEPIFGVSVVQLKPDGTTMRLTKLCTLKHSLRAAHSHIEQLKKMSSPDGETTIGASNGKC
jgi:hypothetical protein